MTNQSIPEKELSRLSRFFVDFGTVFFLTNVGVLMGSMTCVLARAHLEYSSKPEFAANAESWVIVAFPFAGFLMGILLCSRRKFLKPAMVLGAIGTLLMLGDSVPKADGTFGGGIALLIFFAFLVLNLSFSLAFAALMIVVRIKWR